MFASSLKDDDMHLSASLPDDKNFTGGRSGEGRSTKFSQRIPSGVKRVDPQVINHTIIHEEESSSLKTVSPLTDSTKRAKIGPGGTPVLSKNEITLANTMNTKMPPTIVKESRPPKSPFLLSNKLGKRAAEAIASP